MRHKLLWLVIWSVVGMTSCQEKILDEEDTTPKRGIKELPTIKGLQNKSLIGRWLLTDYYMDPGDGSGKYQKVSNEFLIEFRSDSTLAISGKGFILSDKQGYRFRKVDDRNIEIFRPEESHRRLLVRYKATETELEMRYWFCVEGCGEKYKAIQ